MDTSSGNSDAAENEDRYTELFHEEAAETKKPWWKTHFFVRHPVLFGTWDGVFTSCLINIFGVVLFMRTGWMVGNAGVGLSIFIVFLTISVSLLSSLAAIGICDCLRDFDTGGVYFIISHVLGGRIGGAAGVMYALGLCAVAALYCTGFAESVTDLLGWTNPWAIRGTAAITLLVLVGINLAGVKWVIRLQLLLFLVLIVSTSDFIIGTVVHTDPDAGFVGYSSEVLSNNTYQSYSAGEDFFSVFGVFFPTATGVMAGVNMSGDLKTPRKSIPLGTLSAVFLSFVLYLLFVLLLGSTCLRSALQTDFMIAEKVSAVSFLWLAGLYMSSTSSCSTGLYGAPRVLQSLAQQNVVPIFKFLARGFGPNKTPVIAICIVAVIALLFIMIGNLNAISPMITCNFMLVYAVIDYAHFALIMACKLGDEPDDKDDEITEFDASAHTRQKNIHVSAAEYPFGTMTEFNKDLNILMENSQAENPQSEPEKEISSKADIEKSLKDTFNLDGDEADSRTVSDTVPEETHSDHSVAVDVALPDPAHSESKDDEATVFNSSTDDGRTGEETIHDSSNSYQKTYGGHGPSSEGQGFGEQAPTYYTILCNRWLSLFGVFLNIVVMFLINWMYSLINILAFTILLLYISQASPGLHPGMASKFKVKEWIKGLFESCKGSNKPSTEKISLVQSTLTVTTVPEQLTCDNEDYAGRNRYHQAQTENHNYSSVLPIMSSVP